MNSDMKASNPQDRDTRPIRSLDPLCLLGICAKSRGDVRLYQTWRCGVGDPTELFSFSVLCIAYRRVLRVAKINSEEV